MLETEEKKIQSTSSKLFGTADAITDRVIKDKMVNLFFRNCRQTILLQCYNLGKHIYTGKTKHHRFGRISKDLICNITFAVLRAALKTPRTAKHGVIFLCGNRYLQILLQLFKHHLTRYHHQSPRRKKKDEEKKTTKEKLPRFFIKYARSCNGLHIKFSYFRHFFLLSRKEK